IDTEGLRLVEGRDFHPDEVMEGRAYDQDPDPALPSVIFARATAERVFPGKDPIGQVVYIGSKKPMRIVGLVDRFMRPAQKDGSATDLYSVILPVRQTYNGGVYVLRCDPARRAEVIKGAQQALERVDPRRVARLARPFSELREDYYRVDVSMIGLLV